MKMRVFLLLMGVFCVSGCNTLNYNQMSDLREFIKEEGVPLYKGIPPSQYSYRYVGPVSAEYTATYFDDTADASLRPIKIMSSNAKAMGANAVIMVRMVYVGWGRYACSGQAVVFTVLPPTQ